MFLANIGPIRVPLKPRGSSALKGRPWLSLASIFPVWQVRRWNQQAYCCRERVCGAQEGEQGDRKWGQVVLWLLECWAGSERGESPEGWAICPALSLTPRMWMLRTWAERICKAKWAPWQKNSTSWIISMKWWDGQWTGSWHSALGLPTEVWSVFTSAMIW